MHDSRLLKENLIIKLLSKNASLHYHGTDDNSQFFGVEAPKMSKVFACYPPLKLPQLHCISNEQNKHSSGHNNCC